MAKHKRIANRPRGNKVPRVIRGTHPADYNAHRKRWAALFVQRRLFSVGVVAAERPRCRTHYTISNAMASEITSATM